MKVLYLPSNETAIVTKVVSAELVYIRIDRDKEELPAFTDDVAIIDSFVPREEVLDETPSTTVASKLKDGLYLFIGYKMGSTPNNQALPVVLYNQYPNAVHYDINTYTDDDEPVKLFGPLVAGEVKVIHFMALEKLEKGTVFEIDWYFSSAPTITYQGDLKLKPATFFKKYGHFDFNNSTGSIYEIPAKKSESGESQPVSLTQYTKSEIQIKTPQPKREPSHDVKTRAAFNNVIDLHIEKLHADPGSLKKGEMLQIQLRAFDVFIADALKNKINKIFVIHGVGNGKLKNEIATKLILHPGVSTFSNEFMPQFGFGATEVILY